MSFAEANGHAIASATIALPRVGVWHADLILDTHERLQGAVQLKAPGLDLRGTVVTSGVWEQRSVARVAGGAHKLGTTLPAKHYKGVPLRLPLGNILTAAGERLAATSSSAILDAYLPAWVRREDRAGAQLDRLLDGTGATWRALPDGTIWVGTETWPASKEPEEDVLEQDDIRGSEVHGSTRLAILPGTTYRQRRVSYVEHTIDTATVRTALTFEAAT